MRLPAANLQSSFAALVLLAVGATAGCDRPQAMGDANAIIVGIPDAVWPELRADVEAALEPRAFTVRNERIFRVTQVDPTGPHWGDARRFRQVLLIGEPGDAWVAEALEQADGPLPPLPAVVRAYNVWARGQQVTVALTPPGAGIGAVRPLLPAIGDTLLRQYQEFAVARMFASGADSALADSLQRRAGFSLLVPNVYRLQEPEPNVYIFRNDQPDPSRLIRQVLVTWRPSGELSPTPNTALAWRQEIASRVSQPPQVTGTDQLYSEEFRVRNTTGVQLQGVWSNPPGEWPAAGPFITRVLECPAEQRTYLLDAWLYAPGVDKYEYMVQLLSILDSFECGGRPSV